VQAPDRVASGRPPKVSVDRASVRKVCQLTGEWDRERAEPAFNQTETRFGLFGTDLGSSFDHAGRLWFLFGDTWPGPGPTDNRDSVAWTTATEPEPGVRLELVADDGHYRPLRLLGPDGGELPTAAFEVPIAGVSVDDRMYVFHSTDHFQEGGKDYMGRTVLALAQEGDPTDLRWLYDVSVLRQGGRFINVACAVVDDGLAGLPFEGPALVVWGSGRYRESDVYLASVPLADIEQRSAWRFLDGLDAGSEGPRWGPDETSAVPLFAQPQVGELSVSWIEPLGLWLMLYNAGEPRGINGRVAAAPWGPWSDPVVVFDPGWPGIGYGHFMHVPNGSDSLSDPGREHEWGGEYGPYLVDRFTTRVDDNTARVYFVLSTWNPYNTVLMTATVRSANT
jgi:hypothetical protein